MWLVKHLLEHGIVDKVDSEIINCLLVNSRQSTQAIADSVGIKRPTAHERIKKLYEKGIIEKSTLKLNYPKCGLPLRAFILVAYKVNEQMSQKDVAKHLSRLDYVVQVNIITGSYDFLVEVVIDYMNSLGDVIIEAIRDIDGVGNTETLISFKNFINGYETNKPAH